MQVVQLNKHLKDNRNRMTRKIGKWVDVSTDEIFKGKKVILFSLPGAFTPVCSEKQLPGFEENYDKLLGLGINEVYCISVNDGFVMNAWADQQNLSIFFLLSFYSYYFLNVCLIELLAFEFFSAHS